jgi:hypothetical protein
MGMMQNAGCSSGIAPCLTDETSISKWSGQKAEIVQFQPVKIGKLPVKFTVSYYSNPSQRAASCEISE